MSNELVRPGGSGPKMRAVGTVPGDNGKREIVYLEEPTLRQQWRMMRPSDRFSLAFLVFFFLACIGVDFALDRLL